MFFLGSGGGQAVNYGLAALDLLPQAASWQSPAERNHFAFNYGFNLNILFLVVSVFMVWLWRRGKPETNGHNHSDSSSITESLLRGLTVMAIV